MKCYLEMHKIQHNSQLQLKHGGGSSIKMETLQQTYETIKNGIEETSNSKCRDCRKMLSRRCIRNNERRDENKKDLLHKFSEKHVYKNFCIFYI